MWHHIYVPATISYSVGHLSSVQLKIDVNLFHVNSKKY